MELGQYKNAENDITQALTLLPLNPTLLYFRAVALIRQKSFKLAAIDLEIATSVKVDNLIHDPVLWEGNKFLTKIADPPDLTGEVWYNLGCMRAVSGDRLNSALAFARAEQASPGKVVYCHELAKSLQVGDLRCAYGR